MTELLRAWNKAVGRWKAGRLLAGHRDALKLDLGCGTLKRPGFIGLDLNSGADVRWNMTWGLPFPADSIAEIRSDHFFEHLDIATVVETLRECHRVLVPGGKLDFTVPHLDPFLQAYCRDDIGFLTQKIYDIPDRLSSILQTKLDRVVWLMHRDGEHRAFFDRDSILHKVRLAGFSNPTTRSFDSARDSNERFSSIYVVATK